MPVVETYDLIKDEGVRDLVSCYEAILREMRTHARAPENRLIREWVERLDQARDEFVKRA